MKAVWSLVLVMFLFLTMTVFSLECLTFVFRAICFFSVFFFCFFFIGWLIEL